MLYHIEHNMSSHLGHKSSLRLIGVEYLNKLDTNRFSHHVDHS
jgi:hypothetical protein